MNIFGVILAIGSVIGTLIYYVNQSKEHIEIDPYHDYEAILDAALAYKEEREEYAKDFSKLIPYLSKKEIVSSGRYALSLDGKFLTIAHLETEDAAKLINEIGGESYINGKFTYLTLMRRNDLSKIKPIAHFNIKPDSKINTTSVLQYDTSGCVAEDNEIVEKRWENKQMTFKEPGVYTIRLKIKDRNGNWSDSFERDIKVTEEIGIKSIECYDSTMFILYRNGKVISKGKNEFGQLGIGNLNAIPELKYNSLHDGVSQIACGENFTIFKLNDGTLCASGSNRYGELASGDKNSSRTLNVIWGLENVKQIAAGKHFAAALDFDGNVYVWGDNSENQLMKEDLQDSVMPLKLEGIEGIKSIALGSNFGFAVKYDGTVIGWGDNTHGQLGLGFKGRISEPAMTLYKNVAFMTAGEKFSIAVAESGRVYGTGNNAYGQLGTKGKSEIYFPTEVLKVKDIATAYAKESVVLAINTVGKAFIWGNFSSPGTKPINEPEEIPGVSYISVAVNTGKKCYLLDGNNKLQSISDMSGKNEMQQLYQSFYEFCDFEVKFK
ncbi:hypothetical protein [Fusibacter sp. 3D3]|uniref:RCC1 domain-containing protein n=1 Tax=Fusibacter sp. 3D3 TaxID=1048380 RepID=UPI000853C392|nr:hypothetical protein [Fusibacter sp. 3D3]GAU79449.1 BNR repeat domain protein [Fusibacter sp. 3D3]